ncbi:MAG: ATP-binding protein, partial [Bacteroidota bacterium]
SVKDIGFGIYQEYLETVFAMFKRLQNREKYEGSGMGLSNCKKIVTKLGGKIWVVSDGKSGSTFYFTIPKGQIKQQKETEQLLEIA